MGECIVEIYLSVMYELTNPYCSIFLGHLASMFA